MKNSPYTLIQGGCVLTLERQLGNFQQADVLLHGARIAAVGPHLPAPDGCQLVDATGMIVMPGLVDSHRHLWETSIRDIAGDWTLMQYLQNVLGTLGAAFRPDDVYVGNLLGMLEALNAGVTTVFDWSHIMNTPEHADAAVLALRHAGGRAVFGHGTPGTSVWEWFYESQQPHPADVRRVQAAHFSASGPEELVTLALAIRGPEYSAFEVSRHDIALARELGLRVSMHVGAGGFGPKYQAITQLHQAGLLGPDLNFAHCNSLTDADFRLLADHGCSVSVTPEVEMQMGLGLPATGKALAHGIRPALGVDVVTGTGGDLFAQMKIALQTERALRNEQALTTGQMLDKLTLTTQDALEFATIDGAKALGLDQYIGSLTPGKQADLILLDASAANLAPVNNPVSAVVLSANPANVDSVFVAGQAVKRHGRLLQHDLAALHRRAQASRDYLFAQTGVPEGTLPVGSRPQLQVA